MSIASTIQRSQVDLQDFVDWSGVECLNQNSGHSLINALKQGYRDDDGLHLESDADEQLLIYIPFTQVVKLHSILFVGPEEEGPRTVKLLPTKSIWVLAMSMIICPVTQLFSLKKISSLTIFVEDNQGSAETSKVQKIILYGTTSLLHYYSMAMRSQFTPTTSQQNSQTPVIVTLDV